MGTGGKIKLEEGTGGGTHVGFKASDSDIVSELLWTLPSVDGSAGQVMATDGNKNLNWMTFDVSAEATARANADSTLQASIQTLGASTAFAAESATVSAGGVLTPTSDKPIQRITSSLASLGTVANPISGEYKILINSTGASITILNNSGLSASSIMTGTGGSITLPNQAAIALTYDTNATRWFVVGFPSHASTGAIIVDAAGGGDYTTVGAALTAATAGKTVFVRNGNYDLSGVSYTIPEGVTLLGESREGVRITSNNQMFTPSSTIWARYTTKLTTNFNAFDTATGIGTVSVTNNSADVVYTGDLTGAVGTLSIGDYLCIGNSDLYAITNVNTGTKTMTLASPYTGATGSGLPVYVASSSFTLPTITSFSGAIKNLTLLYTKTSGVAVNATRSYRFRMEDVTCYHANTGSSGEGMVNLQSCFQSKLVNCKTVAMGLSSGACFTLTSSWGLVIKDMECERAKYNYWGGGSAAPCMYSDVHFKRITDAPALFFLGWGAQVYGLLKFDHIDNCRGGFIQDGGGTAEDLWNYYIEMKLVTNCSGQISFFGKNMVFVGGSIQNSSYFRFKSRQGSTNNSLQSGSFLVTPASSLEVDTSTIICSAVIYPTGSLSGSPKRNDGYAF
jgi:hypothetical protein